MAQVEVLNENTHPFTQKFKGETITIPPGGKIKMDFEEAHQFLHTYSPLIRDGDGGQTPESKKKLQIIGAGGTGIVKNFVCHQDGKAFSTQLELERYVAEHHSDSLEDQSVAVALKKKRP